MDTGIHRVPTAVCNGCYLDKRLSTKSIPFFVLKDASRFRRRVRVALVLNVTWLEEA
jgi:hypothetical protein